MTPTTLFAEHDLRQTLNDEFHARPPVPLESPQLISYLAFHQQDVAAGERCCHAAGVLHHHGVHRQRHDCRNQQADQNAQFHGWTLPPPMGRRRSIFWREGAKLSFWYARETVLRSPASGRYPQLAAGLCPLRG